MPFPTEEEIQHQRSVIRETYSRLFEAVEGQLRYVGETLPTIETREGTTYDLALSAHLARASKTAFGITVLCEYGFGEMAMGALRSLGEAMVSAYFMSRDPEARSARFESVAKLEAINTLRFADEMGWATDLADAPPELRDEAWLARVRREFPNPVQGWMQLPMNDVIAEIEPCWTTDQGKEQLRQTLRLLHLFGDRHSHVGTYDTVAMLSVNEGQLVLHLGPGKKWVPQALVVTAWVYGQIFDLWAEHFRLPDLDSWKRHWGLLIARCRTVNREAAKGVGRNDPCPCGSGFKFKHCHLELLAD